MDARRRPAVPGWDARLSIAAPLRKIAVAVNGPHFHPYPAVMWCAVIFPNRRRKFRSWALGLTRCDVHADVARIHGTETPVLELSYACSGKDRVLKLKFSSLDDMNDWWCALSATQQLLLALAILNIGIGLHLLDNARTAAARGSLFALNLNRDAREAVRQAERRGQQRSS